MAYSELIKSFGKIRDYMLQFYVYGFKSRTEYTAKSARSYDDERRRIESWLGRYMRFRQTAEGKNVFISIDSRVTRHNPLYAAWKAKTFTDGDITLHFIIFDILHSPEVSLSLNVIADKIDGYLACFDEPKTFDVSTLRKKLSEYASEGIIISEKRGKAMFYRRADSLPPFSPNALDFFSEVAPCGVIGSYLLDRQDAHNDCLVFKHHYITAAMDSEILYLLFSAMREKRSVTLETTSLKNGKKYDIKVIPLRVMISAQSGRQYLMAYSPFRKRISSFRTDNIISVKPGDASEDFDLLREKLEAMLPHIWGVSAQSHFGRGIEHVEFTVKYNDEEAYIHRRLEREKRCGTVEKTGENASRFSADVYDSSELIPWIRTFICRITDIHFSNETLDKQFKDDIKQMYAMYGLEGGDEV